MSAPLLLNRYQTERAERLHLIFHLLAECTLLTHRDRSKSRVGCYTALDKIVPVFVADECNTVGTGEPVDARGIGGIAVQSLDGSAKVAS